MKAIKFVCKLVLWIVGIVLVLLLALPLWIGPVAKTAANSVVPSKTGTPFNLGAFALNPYTGKLSVGRVLLGNPEGFSPETAVSLESLDVSMEVTSLAGDVIVINDINLSGLLVSYVVNRQGQSNFTVIKQHAADTSATKPQDAAGSEASVQTPQTTQVAQADQAPKKSKKIIIDHLKISNVSLQLGPVPLPLPTLELNGIGRKSNGVTFQEAWDQIYKQVMQNANALGANLGELTKKIDVKKVNEALNAVKAMDKKGLGKALEAVGQGTGKTVGAMGEGTSKAVDAVGQGTGKTVEAVGKGTEKAVDATTEQIDKAVNVLKGFLK